MSLGKIKLNLGCGKKHKEGFINIDIHQPADVILKLGIIPLPFKENSIDEIEADNLLEHLSHEEFLFLMNDAWRVCKPGGRFWIRVPDVVRWPTGAFGDPTHKMFLSEKTFDYFTPCTLYRDHGEGYGFKLWIKTTPLLRQKGFLIAKIRPIKK